MLGYGVSQVTNKFISFTRRCSEWHSGAAAGPASIARLLNPLVPRAHRRLAAPITRLLNPLVPRALSSSRSVARELFTWQLALLLILILGACAVAVLDARRDADELTRQKVIAVTESVARMNSTAAAIASPDPTALLQPQTESIRRPPGWTSSW